MINNKKDNNENFWISYADLMAGLLFVFILLIGAIIIKYMYAKDDLKTIRTDLQKEKQALNFNEKQLENKKKILKKINKKLEISKGKNLKLSFELARKNNMYKQSQIDLQKAKKTQNFLSGELLLSQNQIKNIIKILNDKENKINLLDENLKKYEEDLKFRLKSIKLNLDEIEKLKSLLFSYELNDKKQQDQNELLSKELNQNENIIRLKDDELLLLEQKLIEQSKSHQKLVEEFDIAKVKIKHLTGIKITVIATLRQKLGKIINIDKKSGAIKFSSNILFAQGQYKIKEESKQELKNILKKYIDALLNDESIRKYIHSISIEGHTNSDGTYLQNLELSQKRAYEVMKFLYTSKISDKKLLRKYISASGRSYSDLIYTNNKEDKDNSRRIEITFRIKNDAALKELGNFLNEK